MSKPKLLFALSGSIACYKACHVISRAAQAGIDVQTVATASALQFVGKATLEGLSGKAALSDSFEDGRMMGHIHLAKWADLTILCPATANTINSLAAGIAQDLVGSLFLAHDFDKPYWIAPAMNQAMWRHPATVASLGKLETWGVRVLSPEAGRQACGDEGLGRLAEPDSIVEEITSYFRNKGTLA